MKWPPKAPKKELLWYRENHYLANLLGTTTTCQCVFEKHRANILFSLPIFMSVLVTVVEQGALSF